MSTNIVCAYADGNDPRADMGNAGGKIIRGAFLGNILKLFSLCSFFHSSFLYTVFAPFSYILR